MIKRILAILLALCILFSAMLACADDTDNDNWDDDEFGDDEFGDDELDEDDFETETDSKDFRTIAGYDTGEKFVCGDFVYQKTEDGEGAILTNYSGTSEEVVIPSEVDGFPVVAIGAHMFAYNEKITSIEIPEGILTIGNMAFFKCMNLQGINIPEGIKLIDECCFGDCQSLAEVHFPDSLEEVGRFSFLQCLKLTEISFGDSLTTIGPGAFQLCASLSKVSIPGGDKVSIEPDSFLGCSPDLQIIN